MSPSPMVAGFEQAVANTGLASRQASTINRESQTRFILVAVRCAAVCLQAAANHIRCPNYAGRGQDSRGTRRAEVQAT
jgi:hypothetical protein